MLGYRGEDVEKREHSYTAGGKRKLVQPLWKTIQSFSKKLKIKLLYNPAIPLLSIYPKETKTLIRKDICTPVFIAALFTMEAT